MKFENAVLIILKHEGGYVNDPDDLGGETNYGISKRYYPDLDIKNLTVADATMIYKRDYWDKYKIGQFPAWLRLPLFDGIVNQSGKAMIQYLQSIIGVFPDGIVGNNTITKAHCVDAQDTLSKFMQMRLDRYMNSKTYAKHGRGWVRRLTDVASRNGVEINMSNKA